MQVQVSPNTISCEYFLILISFVKAENIEIFV
jgi:hypothetical protein